MLIFAGVSIMICIWTLWGGALLDTLIKNENSIGLRFFVFSLIFIVVSLYIVYFFQVCNIIDIF